MTNSIKSPHSTSGGGGGGKSRTLSTFLAALCAAALILAAFSSCGEIGGTSYTVTFNANGGTAVSNQTVKEGEKAQKPQNPTKEEYTFAGWYKEAGLTTQWNFDTDTVTADITLYAKWLEGNISVYTVTFESNGGSVISPHTVAQGSDVFPNNYQPTKSGYFFVGWYIDQAFTQLILRITITQDITLYAKWILVSELEDRYVGVWRGSANSNRAYLFEADGTGIAFHLEDSYFDNPWHSITWSPSQINGSSTVVNFNGDTLSFGNEEYTKNTRVYKTPAKADSLVGVWVDGESRIEFKTDATAGLESTDFAGRRRLVTLAYRMEGNELFLLYPSSNLVLLSIPLSDGKPQGFSKVERVSALTGIWKATAEDGQDYYYTLDDEGRGMFTTLGASIPVSLEVTEESIDGRSYTITSDGTTLTVNTYIDDSPTSITYTKVTSIPQESGAGGDSRLYGRWKDQETNVTITFNADGSCENRRDNILQSTAIWKADDSGLALYIPENMKMFVQSSPYTVSGSTLTIDGIEFIKQ